MPHVRTDACKNLYRAFLEAPADPASRTLVVRGTIFAPYGRDADPVEQLAIGEVLAAEDRELAEFELDRTGLPERNTAIEA